MPNQRGYCRRSVVHHCRSGGAVLEMALVLPILVMLTFGISEYGYFFFLKNTFQGAAQAGVRAAVPYSSTNANVVGTTGVVTEMLTAAGISSSNYTVTISPANVSGLSAGTNITVTITATWGTVGVAILGTSYGAIPSTKTIKGVAVMQKESS
jgi:Flp pilus assembly protein TadG